MPSIFLEQTTRTPGARVDCTMCYNMMSSMVDIAHTGVDLKSFFGTGLIGSLSGLLLKWRFVVLLHSIRLVITSDEYFS